MTPRLTWLLVALGWVVVAAFVLLRLRYPYGTIQTDNFAIRVPQPWLHRSTYVIAFLELCRRTAQTCFELSQNSQVEVEIRPSWRPAFWFQPGFRRIVLCFLFGPAIDRWFFSIYFAVAHEYGHLVSPSLPRVESEAWANLFCLYTLRMAVWNYEWPCRWERWLVRRDALAGLVTMHVWRLLPGRRREIAIRFWKLWAIAQQDSQAIVSTMRRDS